MASRHWQAYLNASEVIAASPSLDVGSLNIPDAGGDALLVVESNGHGLIAARTEGAFTHVVAGLETPGPELWEAPHWRADGEYLEEIETLEPGPLGLERALELLADAPPGVHAELLDAALDGPVVLIEDDPERRVAWIAWLAATVPGPLTFATFTARPLDVRVSATTREHAAAFPHAIDTARASIMAPSRYAQVATTLAARNPAALAPTGDAVGLAVAGGATELLTPEDLPKALEAIIALAQQGEVAIAARAAAGLGEHPLRSLELVRPEPTPTELQVVEAPEPETVDAEIVEEEFFETGTLGAFATALTAWTPPTIEVEVIEDEPEPEPEPEPAEVEGEAFEEPITLAELESLVEAQPGGDAPPALAEGHDALDELLHPEEPVAPVFVEPEISPASGRSLDEMMASFTTDPLEEPEEVIEEEVGMSLEEFERSLKEGREP